MLQKQAKPYVTALRFIQLFELDLNGAVKLLMGRYHVRNEYDNGLNMEETFGGRPGKSAHDALNRVQLTMDACRTMRTPFMAMILDAAGCFDRF